jgi:hypothetical protein
VGRIFERMSRGDTRKAADQNSQSDVTKFVSHCHGMSPFRFGLRSFAHFLFHQQGWHAACDT